MNEPHGWHLAQLNVARAIAPLDSAVLVDFMMALERINALADAAPGFVWRLQTSSGSSVDVRYGDDDRFIVNMSVWRTPEELFDFVYRTAHTAVMQQRRRWFEKASEAHQVLFWVPVGHVPSVEEAMSRLDELRRRGPSPAAFTFKARFPPPGTAGSSTDMKPEPYCTA
jgi:hypothetical protein